MYDIMTIVLGIIGMFVIVGGVAYFFQNRAKKDGNLFTQPSSMKARVLAFVIGSVFAGFFLLELVYLDRYHIVLPFLSIFLFMYGFGFNKLIETIQKKK